MAVAAHSQYNCLIYNVNEGVATVTLNRHRKKNALNKEMWTELILALRSASRDDRVVVCVLTGSGDYFSSGNDLNNFIEASKRGSDAANYMTFENVPLVKLLVDILIDFPKQLIAAVNGPAIGIAVTSLGLMDVVYASDTATFLTPFTSLGQCAEACSSYTFPKIMGPSKAYEVLFFGRKLSAQDAKDCNLISEVFPEDSFQREVQTRALKFAALPRKTLQAAKKLCRDGERDHLRGALKRESDVLAVLTSSDECRDAIKNFFVRKSKM
ncbi:enoyl-CoA delta isomerase 2-like isoform X1 [Apostichopus japonicus]|uniref:enoyl-CoA delta isomerase 2-like isoform X1 n=1 Tax=Stichopus japonicus TaxID=307972 RepID=UPI003AB6D29E